MGDCTHAIVRLLCFYTGLCNGAAIALWFVMWRRSNG